MQIPGRAKGVRVVLRPPSAAPSVPSVAAPVAVSTVASSRPRCTPQTTPGWRRARSRNGQACSSIRLPVAAGTVTGSKPSSVNSATARSVATDNTDPDPDTDTDPDTAGDAVGAGGSGTSRAAGPATVV